MGHLIRSFMIIIASATISVAGLILSLSSFASGWTSETDSQRDPIPTLEAIAPFSPSTPVSMDGPILSSGPTVRTSIVTSSDGLAIKGFLKSQDRILIHQTSRIHATDLNGRFLGSLIDVTRDHLKTFSGETVSFRQLPNSRDMSILQAATFGDQLYFLIGHTPDKIFAAQRIENDHLFSLDLKTGRLILIDQIFGQDFEIASLAVDKSGLYLSYPFKGKITRYELGAEGFGTAIWRNSLTRFQKPKALSVNVAQGLVVLDGFMSTGSVNTPHLLVRFNVLTGQETAELKLHLTAPRKVQLIAQDVALIAHSAGLAAIDLRSGAMQDLVQGSISQFDFDAADSTLYYELASDPAVYKRKILLTPRPNTPGKIGHTATLTLNQASAPQVPTHGTLTNK